MANADFAPLSVSGEITAISARCLENVSAKIFSGKMVRVHLYLFV
jgi:hypothetical protein